MLERNDREYYLARARAARAMSVDAADTAIANIHREMAERYDTLAEDMSAEDPLPRLNLDQI